MKKLFAILLGLLVCLSLTACGGGSSSYNGGIDKSEAAGFDGFYNDAVESEDYSVPESTESAVENGEGQLTDNRKLITTVNLDIETQGYDVLMGWIQEKVKTLGGYIENSDMYSYSNELRNASLTIRVPSDKLGEFVDSISNEGNVTRKSTSEEDVTLNYIDIESHRNAMLVERDTLMELLDKAESLEDTLSIRDRLTNVQWELERLEGTLRTLDSQIDYSTVNLSITEVKLYTEETPEGWWDRASTGFIDTLENIGIFFSELGIFLISNSPVLAILGIIAVVIVIVVKKANKRQNERMKKIQSQLYNSNDKN